MKPIHNGDIIRQWNYKFVITQYFWDIEWCPVEEYFNPSSKEEVTYIKCWICEKHIPVELMPNICYDCACNMKSEPKPAEKIEPLDNPRMPSFTKDTWIEITKDPITNKINEIIDYINRN